MLPLWNRDVCVGRCHGIALLNRLLTSLWKLTMLNVARLVFSANRRLGFQDGQQVNISSNFVLDNWTFSLSGTSTSFGVGPKTNSSPFCRQRRPLRPRCRRKIAMFCTIGCAKFICVTSQWPGVWKSVTDKWSTCRNAKISPHWWKLCLVASSS